MSSAPLCDGPRTPLLAEATGPDQPERATSYSLIMEHVQNTPDQVALICSHEPHDLYPIPDDANRPVEQQRCLHWTYAELHRRSEVFANVLSARGLTKGMRCAALLSNGAAASLGLWTALMMGCPWVPLNPNAVANAEEIQYMLRLTEASSLLVNDAQLAMDVEKAAPEQLRKISLKIVASKGSANICPDGWVYLSDLLSEFVSVQSPVSGADFASKVQLSDLAIIVFTSGTTSLPKGCPWTNAALTASGRSRFIGWGLLSSGNGCNFLPPHGMFWFFIVFSFWFAGGTVTHPSALFDPKATVRSIAEEKCTYFGAVPSMALALVDSLESEYFDTSSLLLVSLGGSVVLPVVVRACVDKLKVTRVTGGFGMSEGGTLLLLPYHEIPERPATEISAGKAAVGCQVKICAPGSREPILRGEEGELHVSGVQTITG